MDQVNSIVRAVGIIDLLKDKGRLSYSQILRLMPLPKSTLFKILGTLETQEMIRRDPETGRYQLGVKLIEWGGEARSQLELRALARPFMQQLNERLDSTVHLAVIVHGEALPIESVEPANWYWNHFRYPVAIGIPAPLYCTGVGKAIMAFLDAREIDRLIREKGLQRFTGSTITTRAALLAELREIRRRGYAVSNGEHDELIRSVAAPIRSHEGRVIASLGVLGIVQRIAPGRVPEIAGQVVAAAGEISRLLGYLPPDEAAGPALSAPRRQRN